MFLIYTRVSTIEQAEDNRTSLAEQERVCRGVAMARGVDKIDISTYSDPGESGSIPLKLRAQGSQLFASLKAGDIVCAAKLDRMFRSAIDALRTIQDLQDAKVGLILPEFGLEPITNNGAGKLFFGILSLVADFERDTINERMRVGKVAKAARGGHPGGEAQYGTRVLGRGRDAIIEVVEEEQKVIGFVTHLRNQGFKVRDIERRLKQEGYKNRTGKDFQWMQVKRIVDHLLATSPT